ncbi:MAG: hypothetical protein CO149_04970 [Nitrospirae bacterium CG_4_9_14_3_um_filter_51_5]|nr:MAG: hypothetical protein CO149_04970 [Nitrospirae bacterium CG_4_9_14_3_um_filter_51_5]
MIVIDRNYPIILKTAVEPHGTPSDFDPSTSSGFSTNGFKRPSPALLGEHTFALSAGSDDAAVEEKRDVQFPLEVHRIVDSTVPGMFSGREAILPSCGIS